MKFFKIVPVEFMRQPNTCFNIAYWGLTKWYGGVAIYILVSWVLGIP
jgi:hypothetical protein